MTRRTFFARMAGAWLYLESKLSGRPAPPKPSDAPEYIVVGSGAGGGTVAARLAEMGHTVLVLEAGGDPLEISGTSPVSNTLPSDYEVPAFHANASENSGMSWDFFVRHYTDERQQQRDSKYDAKYDGIFYPRAGTLGGCTAHNAMILVYPHNQDWQDIADVTGDASWSPDRMRHYFEKLENCRYRWFDRFLHLFGINPSRHGFRGWLHTEQALPLHTILEDRNLVETVLDAVKAALPEIGNFGTQLIQALESGGDPNDWRLVESNAQGIRFTPLATRNHARTGTRDRLRDAAKGGRLTIQLNSLATQVLFEGNRAIGIEYREGEKLYRTHDAPASQGVTKTVRASREVILAGGAFNTPQLLMLSGIGPSADLERLGIPVVKRLEGVGKNLQDRYEVGVVHKMKQPWTALDGADFRAGDKPYGEWLKKRTGVYISNGVALGVIKKSLPDRPLPDLFLFALIGDFHGYFPQYSKLFLKHDYLTWAILKAHTMNPYGSVTLRSKDPLVAPEINFRYFNDGADPSAPDLDSVVEGIKDVRKLLPNLPFVEKEEIPGGDVKTDEQLKQFVMDNAWGHHASCTCKIGAANDPMAVLDSNFKVRGVEGLRVVDASIFPKIPGFFIVSSIYIAAEKAAAAIDADSRRQSLRAESSI